MTDKLVPPFHVEDLDSGFKVVDAAGIAVAYTYFHRPEVTGTSKLPSKETARRMAHQITRLPDLLSKG